MSRPEEFKIAEEAPVYKIDDLVQVIVSQPHAPGFAWSGKIGKISRTLNHHFVWLILDGREFNWWFANDEVRLVSQIPLDEYAIVVSQQTNPEMIQQLKFQYHAHR